MFDESYSYESSIHSRNQKRLGSPHTEDSSSLDSAILMK